MKFYNWKNAKTKNISYGGLQAEAVEAPTIERGNFLINVIALFKSLAKGLGITFSYLIRPSSVVTQQYPENRETLKMADRYRHNLQLKYNDAGEHNCTGCKICEVHCPNVSIIIDNFKGVTTKKVELDSYIWRQDSCTFCNICVLVCPFDALDWSTEFESSVFDRRLLVYQLNTYAGPTAKVISKLDDEKKAALKEELEGQDRYRYEGAKVPMNGTTMTGVAKLGDHMSKKGGGESDV